MIPTDHIPFIRTLVEQSSVLDHNQKQLLLSFLTDGEPYPSEFLITLQNYLDIELQAKQQHIQQQQQDYQHLLKKTAVASQQAQQHTEQKIQNLAHQTIDQMHQELQHAQDQQQKDQHELSTIQSIRQQIQSE